MALAAWTVCLADDDDPYDLPAVRLDVAPVIDGKVGAGEWAGAARGSGFFAEETGTPAPDSGEFWLGYDEEYIYIAGRFKTDPSQIRLVEFRQNVSLGGNDSMLIAFDTFSTANSIEIFSFNARGATNIEISSGRASKTEWLGKFEAAGRVLDDGWEAEARIPWALMPLPPSGRRDMKVNVGWQIQHTQQLFVWKYFKNDLRNFPVWRGVEVPQVESDRSIKLLPYGYAGIDGNDEHIADAGLDVKTTLHNGINLVGTVNPDFRNIEQDVLSLDFSNFERLADESRPFFLEGQQFIRTGVDQRLFASQRIGSFDFGANAYGNLSGRTQFGLLSTMDFGKRQTVVGSATHAITETDSLGFAYVGLQDTGLDNNALQLTYDKRIGDTVYYARSQFTDDEVRNTGSRLNSGFVYKAGGLDMNVEYVQVTSDFFPRLGFSPEQDLRGANGSIELNQRYLSGSVMETEFELQGTTYDRFDGGHYRDQLVVQSSVTMRDGLDIDFGGIIENFEQFKNHLVFFSIEKPRNDPFRT
ncbi:MAG: hypothetical protein IH945_09220 [Armatimonadetes bacterium]|nr:hypothetical protein [Armatimonadota bacterium]